MSTSTTEAILQSLDHDVEVPCETKQTYVGCGGANAAQWIVRLVGCCECRPKFKLYCTACKDVVMAPENAIFCNCCRTLFRPASLGVKHIEPLNRAAA